MNTTSKLVTITAFAASLILAAGLMINAPPYTPGAQLENGLVVRIHFDKQTYQTLDTVIASYEFYNPLKTPVTFTPPTIISTESGYVDEPNTRQTSGGHQPDSVTLDPGETFSINASHEMVLRPGTFSVDVNGTMGTVEISQGQLVARVSTDREVYVARGGSGTATLEIYNSGSTPLLYERFSPLELRYWYLGEPQGDLRKVSFVSWIDRYATVQPGETLKVWSESFPVSKSGTLILDFNGVRRSLTILPD